jgi:hypothetical protein
VPGEHGPVAFPIGKGSGAVTSFSQADGFAAIDALRAGLDAGLTTEVTLIGGRAKAPDIVIPWARCWYAMGHSAHVRSRTATRVVEYDHVNQCALRCGRSAGPTANEPIGICQS